MSPPNKIVFQIPPYSASRIANGFSGYYDVFSTICHAGSYIPNDRLQKLVRDSNRAATIDDEKIAWELRNDFPTTETFRPIAGGSESNVVDPNLQRVLLSITNKYSTGLSFLKKSFNCGSFLALSTYPEPCIVCNVPGLVSDDIPVIVSEAKGEYAASKVAVPQLISMAGGAAINLYSLGLQLEESVIPAIALTGEGFQFFAAYLMRDTFPVLTAISPSLNPITDSLAIASWLRNIIEFGNNTYKLLSELKNSRLSPTKGSETVLDMGSYFFKPIRNAWGKESQVICFDSPTPKSSSASNSALDHKLCSKASTLCAKVCRIMNIYERMGHVVNSKKYILFPQGIVTVPANDIDENTNLRNSLIAFACDRYFPFLKESMTHRPMIVFNKLQQEDGWDNHKPPVELRDDYIIKLSEAIDVLNSANVAHLDLRPSNIMWRRVDTSNTVEIQLIDFEDAELFESLVPPPFIETVVSKSDKRYPFSTSSKERLQLVCDSHNYFYLHAIRKWMDFEDQDCLFDHFMNITTTGCDLHVSIMGQLNL